MQPDRTFQHAGRLKGEVAIVTGAGQGIGRAIAIRLNREGATVAILDKNPETGEATAAKLRELGGRAKFAKCDVTDRESVREVVKIVEAEFGPVSTLVNNAGIGVRGRFLDLSQDSWESVLSVNLTGSFTVSQEVCRGMVCTGRGSIVNVGSAAAQMAHSEQAAYSVSKAGIEALTRVMAFELAPVGIRVNAVAPGTIATEFLSGMLTDQARREREQRIPMGRLGTPEEVADVVAFLISDDARYMTGSIVPIDGGLVFAGIRA